MNLMIGKLLAFVCLLVGMNLAWAETAVQKPNIILIFTDDQGYQDLGCYGSPDIKTPFLDRMADEGMRFTSFYVQMVREPSRGALMTACYPLRFARQDDPNSIHPEPVEDSIATRWKPHIAKADAIRIESACLYNLDTDIGETTDVAGQYQEVVVRDGKYWFYYKGRQEGKLPEQVNNDEPGGRK